MKLRVLIVDDELPARQRLRRLLAEEPDIEVVGECGDGVSAVATAREVRPDVLLLDIAMPGMDGLEVARELAGKGMPAVVFVTGFDQYAVRAFEARALDYLLKPTTKARLAEALSRVRERLADAGRRTIPQPLLDLLAEGLPGAGRVSRIAVRTQSGVVFVPAGDIDRVEAAGNYVILHVGKITHILRETMAAMEAQLPASDFLRISRSAIINLRRTRELRLLASGEHAAVLNDGTALPITRSVREVENRLRFA